jgi:hypothetical protein
VHFWLQRSLIKGLGAFCVPVSGKSHWDQANPLKYNDLNSQTSSKRGRSSLFSPEHLCFSALSILSFSIFSIRCDDPIALGKRPGRQSPCDIPLGEGFEN